MLPSRHHLASLLILPTLLASACADERTQPEAGEVLYRRYCAACHGLTGHGDGPVAKILTPPPNDLTRLRSDVRTLMEQIDGRRGNIVAHGGGSMPVWGVILEQSLISEPHTQRTALLQLQALAEYVHSLGAQGR